MSTTEPLQQLKRDTDSLRSSLNSLQSKVRLSSLRDTVEDLQTKINSLPQQVQDLRARGYPFEKGLESKAVDWATQWASLQPSVLSQIERQAAALELALRPIEQNFKSLLEHAANPSIAQPRVVKLKAEISTLEGKVSAVSESIRGMFDSLEKQVRQFGTHLDRVDWMLKQVAAASFRLLPTEAGVMAVRATWVKGGKKDPEDPQGVLYLTDQRLIFEQKQEIVTKRTLFVVREKQKVQQLGLEVPITLVDTAKASKRGLMGHQDHLELTLAVDAPVQAAHFHLDGQDSNVWQGLIGWVKAGDLDADRAVPLDQDVVDKVRSAPTVCPNCGATLTQQVLRGMDSIRCDYCGKLTRL
ncbi:MAG: hypothetical protein FJ026_12245 [Chloroflexi bacterium]|nr:hypothetical protein [Chloroflexota bacterium]